MCGERVMMNVCWGISLYYANKCTQWIFGDDFFFFNKYRLQSYVT